MKPEQQVAAFHGDTYCLRAAASSPRGGGCRNEGRRGRGDGRCGGILVRAERLSLPSVGGREKTPLTTEEDGREEGGAAELK